MVVRAEAVHVGVTGRDIYGNEVGRVSEVWPYAPLDCVEGPPTGGHAPSRPRATGWFCIDHGGLLGVGIAHFYLPFQAIERIDPDGSITVTCTLQECNEKYTQKPWFANRDIK